MTTTITITLLVLAIASLMCNVAQYQERRIERKEANGYIKTLAKMEGQLAEAQQTYLNEKNHREWAIGRIKDQATLIKTLERMLKATSPRKYNEYKTTCAHEYAADNQ
jgi:hypothetical protein